MSHYPDIGGKNVVVTGASGDIGLAICEKYLEQQAKVFAIYHHDNSGLGKLKTSHPQGDNLHIMQCNVADVSEVSSLANELEKQAHEVHVLINNAGIYKDNVFSALTYEEFDQVIKVNLYGTFTMTKRLLPLLRHARNSTVVNISSISGITSSFGQSNYSAAKAGIIGLTRTLASEMASKGIRVNAVAPGMIESRMVKKVPRQIVRNVMSAIPLKRLGRVDEIANVVAFLSSDASSYIVGQTLVADGGLVMR
ncbi:MULTISPECIES: SDR family NAD(P)-dependent oxidoreductase [Serratia]|jgi:3-oxoacyl-[acyl-carrier protein] reductase|uniref:SDR family oxidoreductase n=1 Tax=Serratia fonticola TaxID=47917 RepID=A0AAE7JTK1_SERFO|nr:MULTISPECIES: SDR family NAD(P)-dependent oxidoreductase [Serratia]ATM78449.1 3-oxoacyl-ACP reductase [Serratia fonticola]MBC3231336.1 SDR family oxidoreductase [Serratia fonticola]MCO7509895.1 SDR family oxidoreductase [Serratia fonticola]QKJ59128.1 SDR family oxidoreductase [Serratia fonticola]CAI1554639.1 3-oxoacyl-[acyl-carrier-protein] reductase FabG [Serratia fonticola]